MTTQAPLDAVRRSSEHSKVCLGDESWLVTVHGEFRYHVARSLVVEPDDLSVLEALPERA